MAAAGGHKNIVKLLIENGADENDENMVIKYLYECDLYVLERNDCPSHGSQNWSSQHT
jgi:hypothetical protein